MREQMYMDLRNTALDKNHSLLKICERIVRQLYFEEISEKQWVLLERAWRITKHLRVEAPVVN